MKKTLFPAGVLLCPEQINSLSFSSCLNYREMPSGMAFTSEGTASLVIIYLLDLATGSAGEATGQFADCQSVD